MPSYDDTIQSFTERSADDLDTQEQSVNVARYKTRRSLPAEVDGELNCDCGVSVSLVISMYLTLQLICIDGG